MSPFKTSRILKSFLASLGLLLGIMIYFWVVLPKGDLGDAFDLSLLGNQSAMSGEMRKALHQVGKDGLSRASAVLVTTRGRARIRFYSGDAPKTVDRIAELIASGFYTGLSFHRVVPGFVVQGGDPTGTGLGGSGVTLRAEFNQRLHVPGAVAMARAQDIHSADSQFYISLGTHPNLDHQYTVFGQVVEGMEMIQEIQVGDRINAIHLELN